MCSRVKGCPQAVSATFVCKRRRADDPLVKDTKEELDDNVYEVMDWFYYLGDMVSAETKRLRCAYKRFRELTTFLT